MRCGSRRKERASDLTGRANRTNLEDHVALFLELIRKVFETVDDKGKLCNRVVAFTSTGPREGVTYVVNSVAKELATQTQKSVVAVDAVRLARVFVAEPAHVPQYSSETQLPSLFTFPSKDSDVGLRESTAGGKWHSDPAYRAACLKALRWNFDYVVIDCPSLATSADALTLAPIVDGVVIVVEAGQTRNGQIQRAQHAIENSGGEFFGFILNQRHYPVPGWLYRRL
jgi:hypothetical protein